MVLKFLGIGSAFFPELKNTSAYYETEDSLYLFDCGETVFDELLKRKLIEKENIKVIITHTHCDHVGSLGSLLSYCYYVQNKKIVEVIHPTDYLKKFLEIVGIGEELYNYNYSLSNEDIKIEAVRVPHVSDMISYGYLISIKGKKVFYSGDCAKIPEKILEKYLSAEIDELYLDISSKKTSHTAHGNIIDLEEMIPVDKRKNVYCMHLDRDYRDMMETKHFGIIKIQGEINGTNKD